jgi:hypothetical protein
VGRRDSRAQDGVIGGAFAFLAQARSSQPNERMEPVEGASNFGANLEEPVVAGDMRELMRKHNAAAVFSLKRSAGGQHDDWAEDSPRERHGERTAALQKADGAGEFVELGKFRDGTHPILVEDGFRVR